MQDTVALNNINRETGWTRARLLLARAVDSPTLTESGLSVLSAWLLIFSFPDFDWWALAWIGLTPLFMAVARRPRVGRAFVLGWAVGTLFFYSSCYWLTHSMIHYGGIPAWVAYPLLVPAALVLGFFPALCCAALGFVCLRFGTRGLVAAPFLWAAFEWARLALTGQLWNAIGYSQAFVPSLIQAARWGGVYLVGFLIVAVNAALAFWILERTKRAASTVALVVGAVALVILSSLGLAEPSAAGAPFWEQSAVVVAVQPNVPMKFNRSAAETAMLTNRHLAMSERALWEWEAKRLDEKDASSLALNDDPWQGEAREEQTPQKELARVVIWSESPMNFSYAHDTEFRELLTRFAQRNRTSVLFNSLEPAAGGGTHNSAVLVNERGLRVAQYDKIHLLPFGEFVPVPHWVPGAHAVSGIVGGFVPGDRLPLMPLGNSLDAARAGVFICFDSAFPSLTRNYAAQGADVLINISNDGYLGRTAVMRQHLANAVFRAVETARPVLRVTNTGITARVSPRGEVSDTTASFTPEARTWTVGRAAHTKTFYTNYGDIFPAGCALIGFLALATSFQLRRK